MKINHKIGFVFIFLCVRLFILSINGRVLASTVYPLQTKYPDIMIYKAHTDQKLVALTFDDGPDERFTPYILDVLKSCNW